MIRRFARSLAAATITIAAVVAVNGCSAGPGDATGSTEEAMTFGSCGVPFTTNLCPSNPNGSCINASGCASVTGAPDNGNPGFTCRTPGGALNAVSRPPSLAATCTTGLAFASTTMCVESATVWACPLGTAVPAAITLTNLHTCAYAAGRGYYDPSGGAGCEIVLTGTAIDSTCVGNAAPGWMLVESLVVPNGFDPSGPISGGCQGGCMIPH